jgi:hypothetical protein
LTKGKIRGIAIAAAAVAIIGTISTYSYILISARSAAAEAIDSADSLIQKASLTCEPGSIEARELDQSQAMLADARGRFDSGSFLDRNAYVEAKDGADKADDSAQIILDEMQGVYDLALASIAQLDYDPAFAFYIRYPHTDEADYILRTASEAFGAKNDLVATGKTENYMITLQKTADFLTRYPKQEKPASVIEGAGNSLVDMAFRNITQLEHYVNYNRSSLEKISATHETQRFREFPDSIKTSTYTIVDLMPSLSMPPEMGQLYSTLADADRVTEDFKRYMDSYPGLNDSRVADLQSRLDDIKAKIEASKQLMAVIKRQYYAGSEAGQAGYAAGLNAREGSSDTD